jgi:hypothetical protein
MMRAGDVAAREGEMERRVVGCEEGERPGA